ncbi:TonB-dependent siderophore receptor [Variovorax sp. LT1R16]|uniref:TonB-dependent siderophore receptor n=1 Tax=Variovorax sp. LT1R16 TaxID=3443728 RepID=UPI003F44620D
MFRHRSLCRSAPSTEAAASVPARCVPAPSSALLHLLLAGSVASAGGWVSHAQAQGTSDPTARRAEQRATADTSRRYDIPAGPLSDVLTRFLGEAGILVAGSIDMAQNKKSLGLHGTFTPQAGLAAILKGSGVQAIPQENGSYLLERTAEVSSASEYSLREIRVTARRDGESEGTGSYTSEAITVGKTAQAMRELPQSVSVLTHQRLADQNITSVGKAAEQAVGITVQDGEDRFEKIYSRGFEIDSIQFDGGAPLSTSSSVYGYATYDLAEYDRVELLRGAAGLLNGTGNPGGAVNLVRKMPTVTPQFGVTLSAGSWDNYRTEIDASGPLAFDGKLRGRAVVAYEKRDYFYDNNSTENPLFYGVLEADIGPRAVLTLGAREQRVRANGTSATVPRYSNGADIGLPRSTGLTTDWSFRDIDSKEVFAKLAWRLANRWTLRANATRTQQEGYQKGGFYQGAVALNGQTSLWRGTTTATSNEQSLFDLNLSGAFDLFGRTHEVLLGADTQDITSRWQGTPVHAGAFPSGRPVNVFNPDLTPWPEPPTGNWTRDYSPNEQKQYGMYGTLRLEVADRTKLILGARANKYKYNQVYSTLGTNGAWSVSSITNYSEPTKVTPFGGLVYDFSDTWSGYVSYAEIYKPQANLKAGPAPGTGLDPMRGSNAEVGVKGELLDGRLNAAFAIYRIVQDGRAVRDPNYTSSSSAFAGSCCYLAQGKVISQGFDAEVNGEVARGVNLTAGYTYNDNRNKTENAAFSTITPRHLIKLWGTWQLPDVLAAWKIGGGATVQSAQYVKGTAAGFNAATGQYNGPSVAYDYTQAGYAVWNAMAEYRVNPQWTVTLNVNNLFDKTYYRTLAGSSGGNFYGEPRNVMVTLRGKFR